MKEHTINIEILVTLENEKRINLNLKVNPRTQVKSVLKTIVSQLELEGNMLSVIF